MNLNLYDDFMDRIAIIGQRYFSCMWSEGYNTTEPFSLELPDTPDFRRVREGFFVGRDDRPTLMLIEGVRVDADRIVLSGHQATRLLDNLAFIGTIKPGAAIDSAVIAAYNSSRKIPHLEYKKTALGLRYSQQISNKSFEELSQTLCKALDCGFSVYRDGKGMVAEFYQPEEDPNLIFSESFGNVLIQSLSSGIGQYKNVAIVLGEGEGENRTRQDVDLSGGGERRELIVDARDLQRGKDESEPSYRTRLSERGVEKLLARPRVQGITIQPSAGDFGKRYDLGDVLTARTGFGTIRARVTRMTQIDQKNTTKTTVEVGIMR